MRALTTTDLDYLTARLHGRRSRMAEGDRLDALCRLSSVSELAQHLWPNSDVQAVADIQRRLAEELVREITEFLPLLDASGTRLVTWMLVRLQLAAPTQRVSWEEFAASLAPGPLRTSVQNASKCPARPFFMKAALDRGYYQELIVRATALRQADRAVIEPLVCYEAEDFRRTLLARGAINYGLAPEVLAQFAGTAAVRRCETPTEPATNRLYQLANRAMRRNPISVGTVVGYVTLRRIEIANLTTLSEGLRLRLPAENIRTRVTPRSMVHV